MPSALWSECYQAPTRCPYRPVPARTGRKWSTLRWPPCSRMECVAQKAAEVAHSQTCLHGSITRAHPTSRARPCTKGARATCGRQPQTPRPHHSNCVSMQRPLILLCWTCIRGPCCMSSVPPSLVAPLPSLRSPCQRRAGNPQCHAQHMVSFHFEPLCFIPLENSMWLGRTSETFLGTRHSCASSDQTRAVQVLILKT